MSRSSDGRALGARKHEQLNGEYDLQQPHASLEDAISLKSHNSGGSPNLLRSLSSAGALQDSLIRTVSREGSILSHPTPDLQSLQGAYVSNVHRLEERAERMSLESDIGVSVKKLQIEQKRVDSQKSVGGPPSRQFSTTSHSNSVLGVNSVARSGGFSPEGYVMSPIGSTRSPSWTRSNHVDPADSRERFTQSSEPLQEGKPLDSQVAPRPNTLPPHRQYDDEFQEQWGQDVQRDEVVKGQDESAGDLHRNASNASGITFQQAFADFDGVHIPSELSSPVASPRDEPDERAMSPTLSESLRMYPSNQVPQQNLVFYPAPVPMILNLPQKLSRRAPASEIAKRRTQILQQPQRQQSMASLSGLLVDNETVNHPASSEERGGQQKSIPPQLRATVYFEQKPLQHNIQIQGGSAVETLDRILNASADAPVGAFTDHPIVGRVGKEVYGKAERTAGDIRKSHYGQSQDTVSVLASKRDTVDISRRSFLGFGKRNRSSNTAMLALSNDLQETEAADNEGEDSQLRGSLQEDGEAQYYDEQDGDEVDSEIGGEIGRPNTLLAELQLRKEHQKQRNRTAATAFPDGMHSTLLQMDAVAQVQKQTRQQHRVTLAWEDPHAVDPGEGGEDDDVPLGMLYPGRSINMNNAAGRLDEDKPLGLLALRSYEDNEPLSHRKARLRGDPLPSPIISSGRKSSTLSLDLIGQTEDVSEIDEEETLAQRKERLRMKQGVLKPKPVSGDFASELLGQFGAAEDVNQEKAPSPIATPDPEETLGQRRKRLLAEKEKAKYEVSASQKTRSMANLLSAHPVGPSTGQRSSVPIRGLLAGHDIRQSYAGPHVPASNMAAQPRVSYVPQGHYLPGYGNAAPYVQPQPQSLQYGQSMGHMVDPHVPYERGMAIHQVGYSGGVVSSQVQYNNRVGRPQMQTGGGGSSYVNPLAFTSMMPIQGGVIAHPGYAMVNPGTDEAAPLHPKQRAMIDRWRQSVDH